jgi:hypothetical protein
MLKWMLDQLPKMAWKIPISYSGIEVAYTNIFGKQNTVGHRVSSASDPRCRICVSGLVAAGLIEKTADSEVEGHGYEFTWYGYEFIEACRPPKPKF